MVKYNKGYHILDRAIKAKFDIKTAVVLSYYVSSYNYFKKDFYRPMTTISEETGFCKKRITAINKTLVEAGILEIGKIGCPPTNYYHINFDVLAEITRDIYTLSEVEKKERRVNDAIKKNLIKIENEEKEEIKSPELKELQKEKVNEEKEVNEETTKDNREDDDYDDNDNDENNGGDSDDFGEEITQKITPKIYRNLPFSNHRNNFMISQNIPSENIHSDLNLQGQNDPINRVEMTQSIGSKRPLYIESSIREKKIEKEKISVNGSHSKGGAKNPNSSNIFRKIYGFSLKIIEKSEPIPEPKSEPIPEPTPIPNQNPVAKNLCFESILGCSRNKISDTSFDETERNSGFKGIGSSIGSLLLKIAPKELKESEETPKKQNIPSPIILSTPVTKPVTERIRMWSKSAKRYVWHKIPVYNVKKENHV
jgi:hypothetical protein